MRTTRRTNYAKKPHFKRAVLAARRLYFYAPDLAGRNIEKLLKPKMAGRSTGGSSYMHSGYQIPGRYMPGHQGMMVG